MKAIISKEGKTLQHLPNFVRNDFGYDLTFDLRLDNDETLDLTGGAVKFKLKDINATVPKVDRVCTLDDPANGICSYKPTIADLDTQGVYNAELEITTGGGTEVNTVPLGKVTILEDV